MKVAVSFPSIPALPPKAHVDAVNLPSDIHAGLKNYVESHPDDITVTGSISSLNTAAGFRFAAPVPLGPGSELLPLVNDLVNPDLNPNLANDLTTGVSGLVNASSAEEGMWKAVELGETLPNLPRAASVTVHIFGLVRSVVDLRKATKQPGPKKEVAVGSAASQVAAALFKLVTDCPGLESAKSSADRLSAAVKIGNKMCLIPLGAPTTAIDARQPRPTKK
jgi:hypothetical protein